MMAVYIMQLIVYIQTIPYSTKQNSTEQYS